MMGSESSCPRWRFFSGIRLHTSSTTARDLKATEHLRASISLSLPYLQKATQGGLQTIKH